MTKLNAILGQELLHKIREDYQELYDRLMEHIEMKKHITYAFAREILAQYNLNLDEEKRLARIHYGNEQRNNLEQSFTED